MGKYGDTLQLWGKNGERSEDNQNCEVCVELTAHFLHVKVSKGSSSWVEEGSWTIPGQGQVWVG